MQPNRINQVKRNSNKMSLKSKPSFQIYTIQTNDYFYNRANSSLSSFSMKTPKIHYKLLSKKCNLRKKCIDFLYHKRKIKRGGLAKTWQTITFHSHRNVFLQKLLAKNKQRYLHWLFCRKTTGSSKMIFRVWNENKKTT